MEQHPVPQNISSYEFRLVGDMTLKQFFQLAGGIIIGVIFFRLPIIGIVKYPLTFVSVLVGIVMAFIPINNRPFSAWITAFIKAIYSPTEYAWVPSPLETEAMSAPTSIPTQIVPDLGSIIKTAVSSTPPPLLEPEPVSAPAPTPAPPPVSPPPPPPAPKFTPVVEVVAPPASSPSPSSHPSPAPSSTSSTVFTAEPTPAAPPPPVQIATLTPHSTHSASSVSPLATSTSSLPTPSAPNVLVGMVSDSSGQPLESATIEIIDTSTGIPARALRTNRLGQFQIAIPLPPGSYTVNSEKEGFGFDPVSVRVNNSFISPIIIKAKPV
jgi:hypothetical protein